MAKRLPITIDADTQFVDATTPISQLVPAGTRSVVTQEGKIIEASDFARFRAADVPGGFDTQTATINKARDVAGLKQRELARVNWWLSGFEPCALGPRQALLSNSAEFLAIRNFPLPDRFRPDHINLCIAIDRYPSTPPLGIYLAHTQATGQIVSQIKSRLNVFRDAAFHGAYQPRAGFQWVCLIAEDWQVNWNDIRRGPNLQKYLAHFYALLAE